MTRKTFSLLSSILLTAICLLQAAACLAEDYPLSIENIRIRDPFVYAHPETKTYYLYAQTGNRIGQNEARVGVEVYKSKDLKHWSAPVLVFERPKDFWGGKDVWAPEMHRLEDWFYLFVTFNGRQGGRGTQIFRAKQPEGPFVLFSEEANTPPEQECLDGGPWIDDQGKQWMIYCHEWLQINDGAMMVVPMKDDFSQRIGDPITLFHASDAPWVKSLSGQPGKYVTDGPFLYKTKAGKLLMLWSSFTGEHNTYAVGIAESENGQIAGPWKQLPKPLFDQDGGHPMLFRTFDGQLTLSLHQPNGGEKERARFLPVVEENEMLKIVDK